MRFQTLISAHNLHEHLNDPQWVVIDCRHDLTDPDAGQNAYRQGHIPGACFAHLDTDLAGPKTTPDGRFLGRPPLPERAHFIETLRRFGVRNDSQVIAYDAHGGTFAARLWWMLRWVGHPMVALLDGGLPAWLAEGYPLSSTNSRAAPGDVSSAAPLAQHVEVEMLMRNLATGQRQILDARAPDRFRGENETLDAVGGHIPGAKNRFFKDNLLPDGRFKPAAQLRSEFETLLTDPSAAVMQCGSGVTACHNLLAMEIAGLHGAALYPGSWSEWSSDPSRPVATGN